MRWILVAFFILKGMTIYQEKFRLFDDDLVCRCCSKSTTKRLENQRIRMPLNDPFRLERRNEVADIDCRKVVNDDKVYAFPLNIETCAHNQIYFNRGQILKPAQNLDTSCEAIAERVNRFRNPSSSFPIAFSRVVYADYEFLEEQLAKSYSTENMFCFAIDRKMTRKKRCRFEALSHCLPNVVLSSMTWPTNSQGSFQWEAQLDCAKALSGFEWIYMLFMQNHDVIIKTNEELRRIFTLFNGRNDIMAKPCDDNVPKQCQNMESNLGRLKLCPTGSKNCSEATMYWKRGFAQMALTREAVDFIESLDTSHLLTELSRKACQIISGADETFIPSLAATKEIGLPGSDSIGKHRYLTRYDRWMVRGPMEGCEGGEWRHRLCVFGLASVPALAHAPQILVNKASLPSAHGSPPTPLWLASTPPLFLFKRTKHGHGSSSGDKHQHGASSGLHVMSHFRPDSDQIAPNKTSKAFFAKRYDWMFDIGTSGEKEKQSKIFLIGGPRWIVCRL